MKSGDDQEEDLAEANKLVPEDALIKEELGKVRKRKAELRQKEKKAFKKMFS